MFGKKKVFGIGFHKTATTSLANALYVLGYDVTGYFGVQDPELAKHVYEQAFSLADRFDAAQDTPWPLLYKELDQRYPGSKFILTIRPEEKWLGSVVKHFKDKYIPAHEWIYGVRILRGNEDVYLQRYRAHNREVKEYFKDRPDDLLVMDITAGDGWNVLCPFLGLETPSIEFPLQNTAKEKSHHTATRALRYLQRNLLWHGGKDSGDHMATGVSSAFVRDILHYHYAMFDLVWEAINQLSEVQVWQKTNPSEYSLGELLEHQIAEEVYWQQRLSGEPEASRGEPAAAVDNTLPSRPHTKDELFQLWNENRLLMRKMVANFSDEDPNVKLPGNRVYVWEVFFNLVDYGTRQQSQFADLLQELGVELKTPTFMEFFRRTELHKAQAGY